MKNSNPFLIDIPPAGAAFEVYTSVEWRQTKRSHDLLYWDTLSQQSACLPDQLHPDWPSSKEVPHETSPEAKIKVLSFSLVLHALDLLVQDPCAWQEFVVD